MKKAIIFIILFAIIAIVITSGLIAIKKNEIVTENEINFSGDKKVIIDSNQKQEEKTIDLYGTYRENDLLIESKSFLFDGFDEYINISQISGLKDKKVEQKINRSIKEKFSKEIEPILQRNDISNFNSYPNAYRTANFSNVISINLYGNYQINEEYYYYDIGLNYNLINGEELKLEDIFREGEDLTTIARIAMYKYVAQAYRDMGMEGTGYSNVYYDKEKGAWFGTYEWYDENAMKMREEIREYIPVMTEYDMEKKINKFMNESDKQFYFSPAQIILKIDDCQCNLNFKDIADSVVIYDKYLTKESLFERDDIGAKSVLTCSTEYDLTKYKETKFESDNFFYDINVLDYSGYNSDIVYPAQNYLNERKEEEAQKLRDKVKEYKKIAASNPDKAYFVVAQSLVSYGVDYEYTTRTYTYNNLFSIELGVKLITCDIHQRKDVLDGILNNYRYHNLGMYGNIYNVTDGRTYLGAYGKFEEIPVQEKTEKHIYNVLTNKEITSVKEIFKEGVDYIQAIKDASRVEIGENAVFSLDVNNIIVEENDYGRYVDLEDMKNDLNLKELKSIIFSSDVTQLTRSDLEGMTKEELYRAYNEIFARHGHDFKTKEFQYYFSLWDWYEPIKGKTVGLDELNEIERENALLIKSVIDEM